MSISYAVFCLKKKKTYSRIQRANNGFESTSTSSSSTLRSPQEYLIPQDIRGKHVQERSFSFFTATATTEIYTLSLHDALPICDLVADGRLIGTGGDVPVGGEILPGVPVGPARVARSGVDKPLHVPGAAATRVRAVAELEGTAALDDVVRRSSAVAADARRINRLVGRAFGHGGLLGGCWSHDAPPGGQGTGVRRAAVPARSGPARSPHAARTTAGAPRRGTPTPVVSAAPRAATPIGRRRSTPGPVSEPGRTCPTHRGAAAGS